MKQKTQRIGMKRKVATMCGAVTVLALFSTLMFLNFAAYNCLKKTGLR